MSSNIPEIHEQENSTREAAEGGFFKQIEHLWKTIKKGLNGVLFTISKNSIASQRGTWLMFFIDFCQLMALVVPSPDSAPIPLSWLSSVFGFFKFSDHIISTFGFMPSLYASLVVVMLTLGNVVYVGYMWSTNNFRHLWTLKFLRHGTSFLVGVGFIPILGIMSKANFFCDLAESTCQWVATLTLLIAILFVALCLSVSIAVFSSNPYSKSATARPHSRVAAARLAVRTILVILVSQLNIANSPAQELVWYISLTVLSSSLCYLYFTQQPFYDVSINTSCVVFNGIFAWMCCCRLFTVCLERLVDQNDFQTRHQLESAVFFGGAFFVIPVSILSSRWWRQHILSRSFKDCRNPYQIELKVRYTMFGTSHEKQGSDITQEKLLQLTLDYQKAVERFNKSSIICLFQILFLLSCVRTENAQHLARRALIVAKQRSPSMDVSFLIYKLRHELEESVGKDVDVISFVKSQRDLSTAKLYDEKCCHTLLHYWQLLLNNNNEIKSIRKCADQISKDRRVAIQAYNEYLRMNPDAVDVMRQYASFLSVVCNDSDQGRKIFQNAERVESSNRKSGKSRPGESDALNLLDDKNAVVAVTASTTNEKLAGEIVSASAMAGSLLNEATSLLQGRNICSFLVPPLSTDMDSILEQFFQTGNDVVFDTTFHTFCKNSNDSIVPVQMRLKLFTNDGFFFYVYFVITPDDIYTEEPLILIDAEGNILGQSKAAYELWEGEFDASNDPTTIAEIFPDEGPRFLLELEDAGENGVLVYLNNTPFQVVSTLHELPGFTEFQRVIRFMDAKDFQDAGSYRRKPSMRKSINSISLPGTVEDNTSSRDETSPIPGPAPQQDFSQNESEEGMTPLERLMSSRSKYDEDGENHDADLHTLEVGESESSLAGGTNDRECEDPATRSTLLRSASTEATSYRDDNRRQRKIHTTNHEGNGRERDKRGMRHAGNRVTSAISISTSRNKRRHGSRVSRLSSRSSHERSGRNADDELSVTSSEITLSSTRIRSIIRNQSNTFQPILVFSRNIIVLNTLVTTLLVCIGYAFQVRLFGDFVANVQYINLAGLRRALLADVAYGTLSLLGFANGADSESSIYQEAEWRKQLVTSAQKLVEIDFNLFDNLSRFNEEMAKWYTSELVDIHYLEHNDPVHYSSTVTAAVAMIHGKALKLANTTLSDFGAHNTDVFTVLASINGDASLFNGLNATTSALVDSTLSIAQTLKAVKVSVTVLGLAFVLIGLLSVFFTLLFKASALHERKSQVINIILEISDETIRDTIKVLEERLENIHGSVVGVGGILDAKVSKSRKSQRGKAELMKSVRSDRSLTYQAVAKMSVVALIPAVYFIFSRLYVDNVLQSSMTQAAHYANIIGLKRGEAGRLQHQFHLVLLNEAFNFTSEQIETGVPFVIDWNDTLAVVDSIEYLQQLHMYGSDERGLMGMAEGNVLWTENSRSLMFGKACDLSRPQLSSSISRLVNYEYCTSYAGGMLQTGLVSTLGDYIARFRSYSKYQQKTTYLHDFESFREIVKEKDYVALSNGNGLLKELLKASAGFNVQETKDLNASIESLALYLVILYIFCMSLSLVFIVNPQFRALNEDIIKFRALLFLIPEEVLQSLKSFRMFMKDATLLAKQK